MEHSSVRRMPARTCDAACWQNIGHGPRQCVREPPMSIQWHHTDHVLIGILHLKSHGKGQWYMGLILLYSTYSTVGYIKKPNHFYIIGEHILMLYQLFLLHLPKNKWLTPKWLYPEHLIVKSRVAIINLIQWSLYTRVSEMVKPSR